MKHTISLFLLLIVGIVWSQSPVVLTFSPPSGAQGETGVSIMIMGNYFVDTPTLDMGTGISVPTLTFGSETFLMGSIDISPTASVGPHDVIVTNPDGLADTLEDGFTVLPETDPPTAYTIFPPECDMFISCRGDTFIIFGLFDENGIDESTLVMNVNGDTYYWGDPEIVVLGDTIGYFFPSSWFTDGDTVDFAIVSVADTFGNVASNPLICQFIVDTLLPTISECEPPMYSSCRDLVPTVSIPLYDTLAGVDSSSFIFTVITPDGDTFYYYYGDPSMRWYGDTLVWEASIAGLEFDIEETVWVCINVSDLVTDEGCGPNVLDTCWYFYFHVPPPEDVDLTVERIYTDLFPLVSSFCLVLDEEERNIEGLDEENFTVWEDYGEGWVQQYPLIVQSLGGCGMVDVVFCIDTTGSMGGMIDDVSEGLSAFAESLSVAGISYRLGLIVFSDYVEFYYGYDLTGDLMTFQSWVSGLGASGGGDGPEVSFDAIHDAIDSMHFRPGATKVIIMATNESPYPHTLGDGTTYSDVTPDMVLANLTAARAMCFIIATYDHPYYHILTDGTGGAFFSWSGAGDFALILPLIAEAARGGYLVSWTSAHPQSDCQMRDVKMRVDCYDLYDIDYSDYLAPCSPDAAIVEPLPLTWTSDPLQRIIMTFQELEDSINSNSIQFMVEGNIFNTVMLELDYTDPLLTWTHIDSFQNAQQVDAELTRVMDMQGNLPFCGPIRWYFWADLMPPRLGNQFPTPWQEIGDHQPQICFDLWDEESGLFLESVLFSIDCRQNRLQELPALVVLDYNSPGVNIAGSRFCWDPVVEGYTFWDRDTVCITILRADDSPDYGDPNEFPDTLNQWCFTIPDDDTLCPDMSDLSPNIDDVPLMPNIPFHIQATIVDDQSGVGWAWVEWDIDGDLDDGTSNSTEMEPYMGDVWQTSTQIPGQSEAVNFVYRIWSCDDDIDQGDSTDVSCCETEIVPLYFGLGPQAAIIEPESLTWTTNADQQIIMSLSDDDLGVDPATIVLRVEGNDYTVDGTELIYDGVNETLYFYPQLLHYFGDGQIVDVELISADDFGGNHLRGTYKWTFYVDLTSPVLVESDPEYNEVIFDSQYDIVLVLNDQWRRVDTNTVSLSLYGGRVVQWGDDGLIWEPGSQELTLIPENMTPEFHFPNGETTCVKLTCYDIEPDYGALNYSDTIEVCFVYAISSCDIRPPVTTPNNDGINEIVMFSYPNMVFGKGILHIFDMEGEAIYTSKMGERIWDCHSDNGKIVRAGIYIYVVEVEGEAVCSGTITVAR